MIRHLFALRTMTAIPSGGFGGHGKGRETGKGMCAGVQCTVTLFRFGSALCMRETPSFSPACRRRGVFS